MYKGFYNLTSAMLTHQQNLNVIGNNMVNISTAGYKQQRYTASTFDDVMYSRVGNKTKVYQDVGRQSYIRANSEITVNHEQGVPEPTDIPLDFAIYGEGFFAVRNQEDEIAYTRSGSFSLDEEGYLCFPGQGYVLGPDNEPIQLSTDKITADAGGRIFDENGGYLGQLGVFTFEDTDQLENDAQGFFTGAEGIPAENPTIYWKYLERSNVDMIRQMTEMLTCQRALQSCATVTKMYDEVMGHAVSDVGRMG